MRLARWWMWVVALVALPATAQPPVHWTATASPASVRPGEVAVLELTATITPPYHIYAAGQSEGGMVATTFTPADGLVPLGGLREPQPARHFDEGFQVDVLTHSGAVTFRQPIRVSANARPGKLSLAGVVGYQACTDTSCLRPAKEPVSAAVEVVAGAVRAAFRNPPPETSYAVTAVAGTPPANGQGEAVSAADRARSEGLWPFLVVAFLAGFAALLTPCVFPMVPITVSFFTKQAGHDPRRRVGLAGAYGGGIVLMYTTLGLALAATMGAGGAARLASNPIVNLNFAALFVFFALSLFGVFELQLPAALVNYTSRKGDVGGYLGAMFMGLTLTLAAFTCTVQFVGGVLVWAANGEWLWPILGMLVFSSAFALPFVLLALFPQYLASMPKSGGWLETTKIVLGWIEIGAALKFLSNADLVWAWRLLTREVVLASWAMVGLLIVLYLWGLLRQGHGPAPERIGRGRQWAGLMFLVLTLYLMWGLTGARLGGTVEAILPPPEYNRQPERLRTELIWHQDYDRALKLARKGGTNVFLDFTGVTCTNCRWMEQNIFTQPAVAGRLAKLTLVRLYTDVGERADEYRRLQTETYHNASLPFYAVITPDGEIKATFDGLTRDAAAFAAFLDRGL